MGTGYSRKDITNNISNGNVINASDLDNEFDGIDAAFDETSGHNHDGSADNGAPITKVGPAQDVIVSTSSITPKTDNAIDLGSATFEFKDLYIDGTANIDSLVADTADINGGTVDGAIIGGSSAAAGTFTNLTASGTVNLTGATVSNAGTITTADINGGTIDGTVIGGASAAAGTFTNLTASGTVNLTGATVSNGGTVTTVDINGGTIDGVTIGGSSAGTGTFTTLNATTVNTTTLDLTNLEVTNLKAKDGTSAATIADTTGKITVSTELAVDNINISGNTISSTDTNGNIALTPNGTGEVDITKVDIDSGTIDNVTIATSNITVGASKTLDVSAGTLTLANDQISGDKVEGGTINAITINTLTSTTVNTTTLDLTNIEVTNIKAKDGTTAATIADSTGKITVSTELAVDNLNLSGNTLSSTDTNGNIILAPNGTGDVQLDADTVRVGDSNSTATITTNGTGNLTLNTNAGTNSGVITITQGANGNIAITPDGTGEVDITKVDIDGGAIDATTIGATTPSTGNFTTVDTTNLEVTNLKAKDGTAAATIADSTGKITVSSELAVDNLNLSGNTLSSTNTNGNITFTANGTGYYIHSGTQAVLVPKGNSTTERPGTPVTGMLRYNTTSEEFEGYSGASASWKSVGGAAITNDTSTATSVYPVFVSATTGTASTLNTSNAKLLYTPSTGELKASEIVASNGILVNNTTVSASYTIASGSNGMSVGPITVGSGATVTVSSGQRWLVL